MQIKSTNIIMGLLAWEPWSASGSIDLHRSSEYPNDMRPRIWVRYDNECSLVRAPKSLLFATSAAVTYIVAVTSAECTRGYVPHARDCSRAAPICVLQSGQDKCIRQIPVIGRVKEQAECSENRSGFKFDQSIHLTASRDPAPETGAGVFAASRSSEFAKRTKFFVYVPQAPRSWPEDPQESAGLLLGYGDKGKADVIAGQRCRDPIAWISLEDKKVAGDNWVVAGWESLGGRGFKRSQVFWTVSTGAAGIYVTPSTYKDVMAAIVRSGSEITKDGSTSINQQVILNCRGYRSRFPTITLTLGDGGAGGTSFSVDIRPEDYVENVSADESTCVVSLDRGNLYGTVNHRAIGMKFLRLTMTVFDQVDSQLGFCHLRKSEPPHPLAVPMGPSWVPLGRSGGGGFPEDLPISACNTVTGHPEQWADSDSRSDPIGERTIVHGGSVIARAHSGGFASSAPVVWVIDSTSWSDSMIYLPQDVFDAITEFIISLGVHRSHSSEIMHFPPELLTSFPSLSLSLGGAPPPVTLTLSPEDYFEMVPTDLVAAEAPVGHAWKYKLAPTARDEMSVDGIVAVRLGPGAVVRDGLLVVDKPRNRVGFCTVKVADLVPRVRIAEIPFSRPALTLAYPLDKRGGWESAVQHYLSQCQPSSGTYSWTYYHREGAQKILSGMAMMTSVQASSYVPYPHRLTWMLDPHISGIHVPEALYYSIKASIIATVGLHTVHSYDAKLGGTLIDTCPKDYISSFPVIAFEIGRSADAVRISIGPDRYIDRVAGGSGCVCTLKPVSGGLKSAVPLGPSALRGKMLLFDQQRSRFSMCPLPDNSSSAVFHTIPIPVRSIWGTHIDPEGSGPEVQVAFEAEREGSINGMRLNTLVNDVFICFAENGFVQPSEVSLDRPPTSLSVFTPGYVDRGATRVQFDRSAALSPRPEWSILQRIEETLLIPTRQSDSPIAVHVHMNLVKMVSCPRKGDLGASRTSQFARAMGIFALIPDSDEKTTGLQVIAGARSDAHLGQHCSDDVGRISWTRLLSTSGDKWTVTGSVESVQITWFIDTVNAFIFLPEPVYAKVDKSIRELITGSDVEGNCDQATLHWYPVIHVEVSNGVRVALTGYDYIYTTGFPSRKCYTKLRPAVTGDDLLPLGIPVLKKLVTVFDHDRDMMGFCNAKFPL